MNWLARLFGHEGGPDPHPEPRPDRCAELARAYESGSRMLATLVEAYGEDSPLVRQQKSYLETLRRELSACRAA